VTHHDLKRSSATSLRPISPPGRPPSQVTEDLKGEGEAHTRLILDEVRALRREIEALRGPSKS
jgi:hypothetical protein